MRFCFEPFLIDCAVANDLKTVLSSNTGTMPRLLGIVLTVFFVRSLFADLSMFGLH